MSEPGGRTALHLAAAAGHGSIVTELLASKADASSTDWQDLTAFLHACRRGHFALARQLSEHLGETMEVPTEQELSGLGMVEGMAVRQRAQQRRDIEGRPQLDQPFVLNSLWSTEECRELLAEIEQVTTLRGWLSNRHKNHPTVDIPAYNISIPSYAKLRRSLEHVILPEVRKRYDTNVLHIREAFFVKYEAPPAETSSDSGGGSGSSNPPRQAGLGYHKDGTLLNCVVLLNNPEDFEGGGTMFAPPLDKTYQIERGDCLCSCGQLLHGAAPVTSGTRYVFIAFIDEQQHEPSDESDEE
eukprot:TRINITY_DN95268_c0_g1_i1.p1 TRINITY_DN95268_c0_g1~~TRINITY_DN95268_c0_g1_i1.p1  ORF type:complete len:339 (-),score=60.73 TRINITY_DN95268_c0_g1_i1:119-1015(-)